MSALCSHESAVGALPLARLWVPGFRVMEMQGWVRVWMLSLAFLGAALAHPPWHCGLWTEELGDTLSKSLPSWRPLGQRCRLPAHGSPGRLKTSPVRLVTGHA